MNHDVERIKDRPATARPALHPDDPRPRGIEDFFHLDAQGPQMRLRGPGGQHQVVGDRRLRPHVEHLEILRLFVIENAGHQFEHLE